MTLTMNNDSAVSLVLFSDCVLFSCLSLVFASAIQAWSPLESLERWVAEGSLALSESATATSTEPVQLLSSPALGTAFMNDDTPHVLSPHHTHGCSLHSARMCGAAVARGRKTNPVGRVVIHVAKQRRGVTVLPGHVDVEAVRGRPRRANRFCLPVVAARCVSDSFSHLLTLYGSAVLRHVNKWQ